MKGLTAEGDRLALMRGPSSRKLNIFKKTIDIINVRLYDIDDDTNKIEELTQLEGEGQT